MTRAASRALRSSVIVLDTLDVGSTDGRERLSLGLKAMRVLGVVPPGGPAQEPGAEAGRVPKEEKDR